MLIGEWIKVMGKIKVMKLSKVMGKIYVKNKKHWAIFTSTFGQLCRS